MSLRDTLTRSIRLTGARALGEDPDAEELAVALTVFQTMAETLVPVGASLADVAASEDYTAGENERVADVSGASITVTLPATITDDCTGDERAPRNGAVVEVCGTSPALYLYCAQLGAWQSLKGLTLDSDQPFGPTHDEGLAAMVAVRIAPDLQQPNLSPIVLQMAEQGRRTLNRDLFQTPAAGTAEFY